MHPERSKWLSARWLVLLSVLLLLAGSITFGAVGPLSAQTVTTTPTTTDSAPTSTPTGTIVAPADTTIPPTTADAASPSASAAATGTTATGPASPSSGAAPAASTKETPTTGQGAQSGEGNDVNYDEGRDGSSPKNIVKVVNKTDNRLRVRGKIQLNHIPGQDAEPENDAEAYGSCTNCATFAIALQIDLISRSASIIIPKNTAIAVNYQCSHCTTVARAVQFVVQVDDPQQTPDNVQELVRQMQRELDAAAHDKNATVDQVEARINAVIKQFTDLGLSLYNQRDQKTDDNDPGGATPPPDAVVLTPTTTP